MLEQRIPYREIAMDYGARPAGSHSKLHTWRDGIKILLMVVRLFKDTRPLLFFGLTAMMFTVMGLLLGIPVIAQWQQQGHVVAVAKAVLAMGMVVLAGLSLLSGVLPDAVARAVREARRGRYLNVTRTIWPVA